MGCVWFVQIITRAKTPEDDVAAGAGSMEREGYPNQAGSAPSMQPDVSAELSGIYHGLFYSVHFCPKMCSCKWICPFVRSYLCSVKKSCQPQHYFKLQWSTNLLVAERKWNRLCIKMPRKCPVRCVKFVSILDCISDDDCSIFSVYIVVHLMSCCISSKTYGIRHLIK